MNTKQSTEASGRLAGRHILVSGAGTGIGRAIAERLVEEGARVSMIARGEQRLRDVAQSLGSDRAWFQACDIRVGDATRQAVAAAAQDFGPLHAVVANSGIGGPNEPGQQDRFEDLVMTNLTGTYHTLRAAQEHLLPAASGRRHMVAVASILARIGVPGYSGYCASKAGILGLVRALAAELAADGVQVNAVAPGWVNTDMAWEGIRGMAQGLEVSEERAHEIAMEAVPLGRMGEPREVAGLVAYLVSEDASGITGQCLDMNGGAWM